MCTVQSWVRGRSTAPQGFCFHTSLLSLQPELVQWKHPKTTHLTPKVDIPSRNILLPKATLSNYPGLLYFTAEFPEALQGRRKRLRAADLEFLARITENTFSCL